MSWHPYTSVEALAEPLAPWTSESDVKDESDSPWASHKDAPQLLTEPARVMPYSRRVPDETDASFLRNVHVAPVYASDEKDYLEVGEDEEVDEEEGGDHDERELLDSKQDTTTTMMTRFGNSKSWLTRRFQRSAARQPRARQSGCNMAIGVLGTVCFICLIVGILFAFNLQRPRVHWQGTLSDSAGSLDPTGFNFTRDISLGFTNANLFRIDLSKVEVWAVFDATHSFGIARVDNADISVPPLNQRNASLPVAMGFAYLSVQDPDNRMLRSVLESCNATTSVPFELFVRSKVRVLNIAQYSSDSDRIPASMTCDAHIVNLVQQQLFTLS